MENQEVLKGHGTFSRFIEDTTQMMRKNGSSVAVGWFAKLIFLFSEDTDGQTGWTPLEPSQARELARALETAARETFDA